MYVPHRYYENLPKEYGKAFKSFRRVVHNLNDVRHQRKHFIDFTEKYTAIPTVWTIWLWFESESLGLTFNQTEFLKFSKVMKDKAISHFYHSDHLKDAIITEGPGVDFVYPDVNRRFDKSYFYPFWDSEFNEMCPVRRSLSYKHLENSLTFPHKRIKYCFDFYTEHYEKPCSNELKKIYQYNYQLYKKMAKALADKDYYKWVECLKEPGEEYLIQNIESNLGKNPCDLDIWNILIEYWRQRDLKEMLNVYSRYCRFFIADYKMRREYFEAVVTLHLQGNDMMKWWKDLYKIENDFEKFQLPEILMYIPESELKEKIIPISPILSKMKEYLIGYDLTDAPWWREKKDEEIELPQVTWPDVIEDEDTVEAPPCIKADMSNAKKQNFAFHNSFLHYILQSLSTKQKLYQTCKFFYANSKIPICYRMLIIDENENTVEFYGESLRISSNYLPKIDSISLSMSLHIYVQTARTALSVLIPRLNKCQLKYLRLQSQDVTLADLRFLNKDDPLIFVELIDVKVIDEENGDSVAVVEKVLDCFPGVPSIILDCKKLQYTPQTWKHLPNLCRFRRIEKISLNALPRHITVEGFYGFVKNHMAASAEVYVSFAPETKNGDFTFLTTFQALMKLWVPFSEKPMIMIR